MWCSGLLNIVNDVCFACTLALVTTNCSLVQQGYDAFMYFSYENTITIYNLPPTKQFCNCGLYQLQALVMWSIFCYLIKTALLMAITSAWRIGKSSADWNFRILLTLYKLNVLMLQFSYWNSTSPCESGYLRLWSSCFCFLMTLNTSFFRCLTGLKNVLKGLIRLFEFLGIKVFLILF